MNDWQEAEQHVERAHELYELGRWDEAETALRRALLLNPYQAEWHFNLGLTLAAAGRSEAALQAFQEAHELGDETGVQACLEISGLLLDLDRAEEAKPWLEQAIERNPDCVDAHVQLIDVHALASRHDEAELHFYLALQLDPKNASAHSTMAESLIDRRQLDRAMWCLQEASKLDPTLPRIFARMAYACSLTGRLERARQLYLREIRSNPGDADTIVDFGRLLMDMNRHEEAGEKFRRALELVPDQLEAHMCLGELAEGRGDLATAKQHYSVVEKLEAGFGMVRCRLARVHYELGEAGDIRIARVLLRQQLVDVRREPDSSDFAEVQELTELLLSLGLSEEASVSSELLIGIRPTDAMGHHLLSVAMFASGSATRGLESARKAVQLRPDFVAPVHNLAVAYLRRGELLRSRYWVRYGIRIDGEDRGLRRLRAYLRVHAVRSIANRLAMVIRPTRRG